MNEPVNQVEAALISAVVATLEGMAFEQIERVDAAPDEPASDEVNLWVSLEIIRPLKGQVIMEMPWSYTALMARAMYGELEGEIPGDVIWDTLAELSNTLAGRFLLDLLGPHQDYALGFPITGRGLCPVTEEREAALLFSGSGYLLHLDLTGEDFIPLQSSQVLSTEVIS
jgi:CheY-specific phosphatase CheX